MDVSPLTQLEQRKLELEGDIRLLTRNREKLLTDIESLQNSKDTVYRESTYEITKLKGEVKTLQEQKEPLKEEVVKAKEAIDEAKGAVEGFVSGEITKVKEVERETNEKLLKKQLAVSAMDQWVKSEKSRVLQLEQDVLTLKLDVDEQHKNNLHYKEQLDLKHKEADTIFIQTKEKVQQQGVEYERIRRDIEEKTIQVTQLSDNIAVKQKELEDLKLEISNKLTALIDREHKANAHEDRNRKKEKELLQKEAWLSDRESTLRRAYQEIVNKGGPING